MQPQGLPGFRDFYPEDAACRGHLFAVWRDVARRYGFEEYDGPPLECLELYTRKSGEEIVEQLYAFTDKGGREVALRPEMTPTLARMIGARVQAMRKPIRWFSIPQVFRYERQQRGRLREHFQLNLDIVGEGEVLADAELLAAAIDVLRVLGLGPADFRARVSDRRLLAALLTRAGVPEEGLLAAYAIVDRRDREPRAALEDRFARLGVGRSTVAQVLEILELRGPEALEGRFGSEEEVAPHLARMREYLSHLSKFGLSRFVEVDLGIVRGLAYYTGIVFELWDAAGELRAICGGGRYDDLLKSVAAIDLPALGFGMGDVVLGELVRARGLAPAYRPSVDYFIVCASEEVRPQALTLARQLREAGRSVVYEFRARNVRAQFKSADGHGAREVIVVGPIELRDGEVVVRDMATGDQRRVPLAALTGGAAGGAA
ncbi:MAG: histidine--tRNA ligase, partial [Gemmatimonadetes bacterium]|nr:histidine--tRNA ligase [Gemmatimonadota bacterium]